MTPAPLRLRLQLFAASFLALFLEMAMVRFVNSTVQVVAYFNNLLILSAFLGLGAGALLANGRRDITRWLPVALLGTVALSVGLDHFGTNSDLSDMVFWAKAGDSGRDLPAVPVMAVVFCVNCGCFIPVGQLLATALAAFEDPLQGYAIDLLGSLAGVAAFALISFAGAPPWVWFSVAAPIALWLGGISVSKAGAGRAVALAAVILLSALPEKGDWSPYYKIAFATYEMGGTRLGYAVMVDKLRIQDALAFNDTLASSPLAGWIPYYRLPYLIKRPGRVLILGGGSGNDAAVALREGARKVTVVEIDPVLVYAGKVVHPEKPYIDPRVRVINDDARAYVRRTREDYDLIVMNALDSHRQLPGLSTLRLESFMYTTEAFADMRRRLAPDGLFVVHLSSTRDWMGQRLRASLTGAFDGVGPRLLTTPGSPYDSVAFVYGPEALFQGPAGAVVPVAPALAAAIARPTRPATDDWPHLYLRDATIPTLYLQLLGLIILFSAGLLFQTARTLGERRPFYFCLLGAGFMLLETRSITQAALLFGSTWIVNAVVIGAILVVIFLGNALVRRWPQLPLKAGAIGLLLSLALVHAIRIDFILNFPPVVRVGVAAIWFGLPVFFASLIFSHSFRRARDPARAFGANLLGVVLGGAVEYLSMVLGLNALYVCAAAIYGLALLLRPREAGQPVAA